MCTTCEPEHINVIDSKIFFFTAVALQCTVRMSLVTNLKRQADGSTPLGQKYHNEWHYTKSTLTAFAHMDTGGNRATLQLHFQLPQPSAFITTAYAHL